MFPAPDIEVLFNNSHKKKVSAVLHLVSAELFVMHFGNMASSLNLLIFFCYLFISTFYFTKVVCFNVLFQPQRHQVLGYSQHHDFLFFSPVMQLIAIC